MVSAYIRYNKAALTTITHRERPWLEARGDLDESEGSNTLMTKECMRNYFRTTSECLRNYFASKLKAYG
ncbi:hypothetical protein [Trichormus azollae]|uniref:hypothetical protein n=1 Tax=Trichormus azollae TaxID=1164 RepID=UPI0001956F22|nr:hypothetical protein [Trichormus azollae]